MTGFVINRRTALVGMGAAATASMVRPLWAQSVAPITIVINQSPWFESFRKTVELYEKETGNKVELDVNPFAGSLEKQRNSVRAAQGQYDILIMNSAGSPRCMPAASSRRSTISIRASSSTRTSTRWATRSTTTPRRRP